jgi:hypothetical protein
MTISGAHVILYSKDADADRAFLRDVLKLPNVDVGGGWLIFALPPAEVATHPGERNDAHELYLMCDDVGSFVADMTARGVTCAPVHEERWGSLTHLTLPGGGQLGVYQPKHASPSWTRARDAKSGAGRAKKAKPKPAKKVKAKPVKKAKTKRTKKGRTRRT